MSTTTPVAAFLAPLIEAHHELEQAIAEYRELVVEYTSKLEASEKRIKELRAKVNKATDEAAMPQRRRRLKLDSASDGDDDILE